MAFEPPTLPPTQPPWDQFQIWWQQVIEAISGEFGALETALAAQAAALAAQSAATAAQTTADTVTRDDAITASYTAPGTTLSAADAGTDATITIADHTRIYGDISDVAVTGGSLTGLAYSTTYYVYYDDPDRLGGAVTYQSTTNVNTALPTKAVGRHYVGKVATPAAGGGSTSGGTSSPSGGGGIDRNEINSTL